MCILVEALIDTLYEIKWMIGLEGILDEQYGIREGSRIRVVQNSNGYIILVCNGRKLALSPEIANKIRIYEISY